MNEKNIKMLCLSLVIIGIIIILIANKVATFKEIEVGGVNEKMVGEYVKICGIIEKKFTNEKGAFLNINNKTSIDAVFFQDYVKAFDVGSFKEGDKICVEGRVEIYDNNLEIIGKKIYYS